MNVEHTRPDVQMVFQSRRRIADHSNLSFEIVQWTISNRDIRRFSPGIPPALCLLFEIVQWTKLVDIFLAMLSR